jgi:hypothetical protein
MGGIQLRFTILFLLLASLACAGPREQCRELGGTWSGFKQRCDMTGHRSLWKDKKFWLGVGIIAGANLAQGIQYNKVRSGGTYAFGNHTSSGDIALWESAFTAAMFGLHSFEWYLGHDDPNKYWRFTSRAMIPAADTGVVLWTGFASDWGHRPGHYPF